MEKTPEDFNTKYRPKSFNSVVGNVETVNTIEKLVKKKAIKVFLLHGPRGCGKTTLGYLISKSVGLKSSNDFKELDLANTGGKDDGRTLVNLANQTTFSGGPKVFLLDEIQEASPGFFSTILKALEKSRNTYFILCTTNPNKLPDTIRSRCSQHKVDLLNKKYASELIKKICEKEEIIVKKDEMRAIIKQSDGCPREILSLLEKIQVIDNSDDRLKVINGHFKNEEEKVIELCRMLIKQQSWGDISSCLKNLKEEPESTRYAILGYLNAVLLNGGELKFAEMIGLFEESFIYSKKAGLTAACRLAIEI